MSKPERMVKPSVRPALKRTALAPIEHTVPAEEELSRVAELSPAALITALDSGLPFRELEALGRELALSVDNLGQVLSIPRATLHRRKAAGYLSTAESEKVVRFSRLFRSALRTFGDGGDARAWLSSPQTGLGSAVPLDYARTEVGAREVENLLGRIEYGVYA